MGYISPSQYFFRLRNLEPHLLHGQTLIRSYGGQYFPGAALPISCYPF